MKSKNMTIALAIALTIALLAPIWGAGHSAPESRPATPASLQQRDSIKGESPNERLADQIIVGLVSEKAFLKMRLSFEEVLEVFKHIRDKRGWSIDDGQLASVLGWYKPGTKAPFSADSSTISPAVTGTCNDWIEMENGSAYASYPLYQTSPSPDECGPDTDDVVLVYNTPRYPNTQTYSLRMWSNLWWVRSVMSQCYGGASANGLCISTTRVCIGSCAKWLGSDLNYLYLWHK